MFKNLLLKSQRNEIFEIIKNQGLDPSNFVWEETESSFVEKMLVSEVKYIDSEFYFMFDYDNDDEHFCFYSPGKEKKVDDQYSGSWERAKDYFNGWLSYLSREIEQPDFWADIAKYQIPIDSEIKKDSTNEPFTAYQADQIIESLNNVRAFLHENKLVSEEHQAFVEDKLNYLEEAVKRQGSLDWIHTCIGAITTIAVALALSPEQTNAIWNFIKSTIVGLTKLLQ